jgi:hypothetical protein
MSDDKQHSGPTKPSAEEETVPTVAVETALDDTALDKVSGGIVFLPVLNPAREQAKK